MANRTLLILNGPLPGGSGDTGDGGATLQQIRDACTAACAGLGIDLEFRQSDDQDQMLDWIARDSSHFDALLINPVGAVDSESYRSALEVTARPGRPVIEVHLDNIFRQGDGAPKPLQGPEGETGFICGLGLHGYLLGISAIAKRLQR